MDQNRQKKAAAEKTLELIRSEMIIGIGTGSTVNFFIDALPSIRHLIKGAVASSVASADRLTASGIPLYDLNDIDQLPVYVDGADEINPQKHMIKGGGGALTREKIVAAVSRQFICICDDSKLVSRLGHFPLPVEVIPMACRHVSNEISRLGGTTRLRENFITDNGNLILDVQGLNLDDPVTMEQTLNQITGIVTHGIFAQRPADILVAAYPDHTEVIQSFCESSDF